MIFRQLILLLSVGLVYSQSSWDEGEDTEQYEDVVTKQSNIQATSGKFEGLFTEITRESEFKEIKLLFLFSEVPYYGTTYFSFYDTLKQALVLDFYDTYLGPSIMDSLAEEPITSATFEELHINLNEGIEGFEPDVRDVVRITLSTPYNFEFNLEPDEFEVLTLYFTWSESIRRSLEEKELSSSSSSWLLWLLGFGLLGGAGAAVFLTL